MSTLPFSPAADRNKQPILEALRAVLPARGRALEIASGTGQHAAWLGAGLPGWQWQPTEVNSTALPTIAAWVRQAGAGNVCAPCLLDVMEPQWPSEEETLASAFATPFDAIFCANMLHISPWTTCKALMQGARRHLAQDSGLLLIYGPFLEDGVPTSQGNLDFDASLRTQNPVWGLRHREAVEAEATLCGLGLRQRLALPANNLLLVFGFR
jgi:SAM-dependent methyltransferase